MSRELCPKKIEKGARGEMNGKGVKKKQKRRKREKKQKKAKSKNFVVKKKRGQKD